MFDFNDTYIEMDEGVAVVRGTRVTLDSIVVSYLHGRTADEIHHSFPSVRLAAVYGTLAFYLDHKAEVGAYLAENEADYQARRVAAEANDPQRYASLRRRLAQARTQLEAEGRWPADESPNSAAESSAAPAEA